MKSKNSAQKKKLFIFDYDGTLTELVPKPNDAIISTERKAVLNKLATSEDYQLAIVTGRALKNLKELLGEGLDPSVILMGTHGAEIQEEASTSPYEAEWKIIYERFKDEPGLEFEPKALSYAIHFKHHKDPDAIKAQFYEEFKKTSATFRVQEGHGVFEWVPKDVNKGMAIDYLLGQFPGFEFYFFGDDLTDNFAHKRVNEIGGHSYQISERLKGENRVAKNLLADVSALYDFVKQF